MLSDSSTQIYSLMLYCSLYLLINVKRSVKKRGAVCGADPLFCAVSICFGSEFMCLQTMYYLVTMIISLPSFVFHVPGLNKA